MVLHVLCFNVMQFRWIRRSWRISALPLILYWCKDINLSKTEYRKVFERLYLLIKGWSVLVHALYIAWLIFSLWQLSDLHQIIRILLYCLIFLLSILGNILVITVLIRNKQMRTVTNTFLLSLAVSDLMLCLFCMPFTLIPNLLKDFIFGSAVCKTATYFMGKSWKFILILKID